LLLDTKEFLLGLVELSLKISPGKASDEMVARNLSLRSTLLKLGGADRSSIKRELIEVRTFSLGVLGDRLSRRLKLMACTADASFGCASE
jgi:hypothetical protein